MVSRQGSKMRHLAKVVYVHCYGHCLNLVLVDVLKNNKIAKSFLEFLSLCTVLYA